MPAAPTRRPCSPPPGCTAPLLEMLEDRLVDRLVWRAVEQGATAFIALAPRAEIDLNREESEIDPALIVPPPPVSAAPSARARGRARPDPVADQRLRRDLAPAHSGRRAGAPPDRHPPPLSRRPRRGARGGAGAIRRGFAARLSTRCRRGASRAARRARRSSSATGTARPARRRSWTEALVVARLQRLARPRQRALCRRPYRRPPRPPGAPYPRAPDRAVPLGLSRHRARSARPRLRRRRRADRRPDRRRPGSPPARPRLRDRGGMIADMKRPPRDSIAGRPGSGSCGSSGGMEGRARAAAKGGIRRRQVSDKD